MRARSGASRHEGGSRVPDKASFVVVANRLPFTRAGGKVVESSGGLVTALAPILRKEGGAWIGWTGQTGPAGRAFTHDGIHVVPVHLSAAEVEGFYNRLSNRTLWPLYHDAIRPPEFDHSRWRPYVVVNHRYAKAAADTARRGATVWVHDYHLQLVPLMLRRMRPDLKIGFFLHIPFPPEELFAWLPWRRPILEGLLGADLVGFHTYAAAQNFSRVARQYTDAEGTDTQLEFEQRKVNVNAFPISIDFQWFDHAARQAKAQRVAATLRQRLGEDRKVMLAVDRLDYTKGIDLRLEAFENMLERKLVKPEECVLIQIASPSREPVPEYAEMRTRIEQIVGRINGEYSEPGRVAVHYFRRGFSREELTGYYRAADVMLVTPLRDGMNLVCKEFVACKADSDGVLVLSEFAGAAREMRQSLLVNPRDVEGMATIMADALHMPRVEQRHRMAVLRMQVRRHDVYEWANEFLERLRR